MEKLFDAIKNTVDAGINQDWTKLGTSIVDIVSNGVSILGKYLDSNVITFKNKKNGEIQMTKLAEAIANTVTAAQNQDWTKLGTSIVDIVSSGASVLGKVFGF